jgi:hypothetical protein
LSNCSKQQPERDFDHATSTYQSVEKYGEEVRGKREIKTPWTQRFKLLVTDDSIQ